MKLGDKVMRLPETFTDSGEDKRSLRRPVVGRVVYIHPKGHYHTVEFELNGGRVRESFKGGERLMTEPKDLCGRCAAMLREGYDLKRVGGGVDHKVTCSHCGRRRYGATYTIEKHSKSKA